MDKYLDEYGVLKKKEIMEDLKQVASYIKDDDFSSAAYILDDIAEALYNCEE